MMDAWLYGWTVLYGRGVVMREEWLYKEGVSVQGRCNCMREKWCMKE